jgi:phage tail tape-measure protein
MTYEQVLELISKLSQEVRELRESQQETNKQIQKTGQQIREVSAQIDKKLYGMVVAVDVSKEMQQKVIED